MRVFIISNYKNKIAIGLLYAVLLILFIWITGFSSARACIKNISVNELFVFHFPIQITASRILVNDKEASRAVETSLTFAKPIRDDFSKYISKDGKFSFEYPSLFVLSPKNLEGTEIIYHIDFQNKSARAHGFVQVWNMYKPLKTFLDESKALSSLNYKYFDMQPLYVNNLQGYYWNYEVLGGDGIYYKSLEAFFKKGDRMYRISYFVPSDKWDKTQSDIFWKMVNTFKVY